MEIHKLKEDGKTIDSLKKDYQQASIDIQSVQSQFKKLLNSMKSEMYELKQDYGREAEEARISRKTVDKLQKEYCRIMPTIASERSRNMIFLETAKRDIIKEVDKMNKKL